MSKLNDFMLQWGVDKFLHFMAGAAIFAITESWIVLLVVSFGKELYDKYNATSGWNNWDALIGRWVWHYLPYTEYLM